MWSSANLRSKTLWVSRSFTRRSAICSSCVDVKSIFWDFPVWLFATLVGLFNRYLAAEPGHMFLGMSWPIGTLPKATTRST